MERTEDGAWAVRLGLRIVAGVGEKEKARIEAESRRGPYADLHDVVRRLPLGRDVLTNLAAVGAFALARPVAPGGDVGGRRRGWSGGSAPRCAPRHPGAAAAHR